MSGLRSEKERLGENSAWWPQGVRGAERWMSHLSIAWPGSRMSLLLHVRGKELQKSMLSMYVSKDAYSFQKQIAKSPSLVSHKVSREHTPWPWSGPCPWAFRCLKEIPHFFRKFQCLFKTSEQGCFLLLLLVFFFFFDWSISFLQINPKTTNVFDISRGNWSRMQVLIKALLALMKISIKPSQLFTMKPSGNALLIWGKLTEAVLI